MVEKISLDTSVEDMDFSVRARNCLVRGNLYTLGDILKAGYDGIRSLRCAGEKTVNEIGNKVELCGYELHGFAEHEAEERLKKGAVYKVYGYNKDRDIEVLLDSLMLYRDAVIVAKTVAKLIYLELLRDTNGEPFDWVVIETPDGSTEAIAYEMKGEN